VLPATPPEGEPIRQVRTSGAVAFFGEEFQRKFGLLPYRSRTAPALFFGCHWREDREAIRAHRGIRVILWAGTDAMDPARIRAVRRLPRCYHIAISEFIAQDLARLDVPFVRLPISPRILGEEFVPWPKGPALYCYTSPTRPAFYGEHHLPAIQERFPDLEIILCSARTYATAELISVYRRCFLGLRLVPHDGLPNTVIELGLMGRRTVHNGDLPGSLAWSTVDDVCDHIERERSRVGEVDATLSQATRQALELPPDWLTTAYFMQRVGPGSTRGRWWRFLGRT